MTPDPFSSNLWGIALLLSDEFNRKFIELQQRCSQFLDLKPVLSDTGNLPHITLIQAEFEKDVDPGSLIASIRRNFAGNKVASVSLGAISYQERGWVFLEVNRAGFCQELHESTIEIARPLVIPPQNIDAAKLEHYTPEEAKNFRQYGYRYVGSCFNPHVTLGRLPARISPGALERCNKLFKESGIEQTQKIVALSAYAVGECGAHSVTLARVDVKGSGVVNFSDNDS